MSAIALSDFGSVEDEGEGGRLARRLRPTLYADTLVYIQDKTVSTISEGEGLGVCDRYSNGAGRCSVARKGFETVRSDSMERKRGAVVFVRR